MGQKPTTTGDASSGGGQLVQELPPTSYDLEAEGRHVDAKTRPGQEVDLKTVYADTAVMVIKHDHQLKLIVSLTACFVCVCLTLAVSVGFLLSSSSDRLELLRGFQPYFMAVLALVAGGAGGAAIGKLGK